MKIDFTYNSIAAKSFIRKGERIVRKCPRCGRRGKLIVYSKGDATVEHTAEFRKWPIPHISVDDSCFFTDWAAIAGEKFPDGRRSSCSKSMR